MDGAPVKRQLADKLTEGSHDTSLKLALCIVRLAEHELDHEYSSMAFLPEKLAEQLTELTERLLSAQGHRTRSGHTNPSGKFPSSMSPYRRKQDQVLQCKSCPESNCAICLT